jgi:hypothetical protein
MHQAQSSGDFPFMLEKFSKRFPVLFSATKGFIDEIPTCPDEFAKCRGGAYLMLLAVYKEPNKSIGILLKDLFTFCEKATLADRVVIKLDRF